MKVYIVMERENIRLVTLKKEIADAVVNGFFQLQLKIEEYEVIE